MKEVVLKPIRWILITSGQWFPTHGEETSMDPKKKDWDHIIAIPCAVILLSCVIILILTSAVIDPYLHSTDRFVKVFDFYENNNEKNKIYFVGNSYTEYGVNASAVEMGLNYSYKIYNLGTGGDTPKHRIVELDNLIKSKPKIVIMGTDTGSFRTDGAFTYPQLELRFGFVTDKIKLDNYSRGLFNITELSLIQEDYPHLLAYKKQLLVSALRLAIANQLRSWKIENVGFLGAVEPQKFEFKDYNFAELVICNKTKEQFADEAPYPVYETDNNNKKAFRYMVKRMTESGIRVIIINMPLNPNCSVWASNETRRNYRNVVTNVGCPYHDLEALCSPMEFRDGGHSNSLGKRNITQKMVEILRGEVKNASQQH